jgi:hypothetical protein
MASFRGFPDWRDASCRPTIRPQSLPAVPASPFRNQDGGLEMGMV